MSVVMLSRSLQRQSTIGALFFSTQLQHIQHNYNNNHNNDNQHNSGRRSNFKRAAVLSTVTAAALTTTVAVCQQQQQRDSQSVDYAAVRNSIAELLEDENWDDGSYGPLFVRLAWHCAGSYSKHDNSGGSNGALMRFHPEMNWGGNKGLHFARDRLEIVKKKHPNISYADLYTLAGVVAIKEMGGPDVTWHPGRSDFTDGKRSPPDDRLPDASQGADHIRNVFYRMGFNDQEIVALSGAHALGRCHTDRSGFEGPWTRSPTTFSNTFYKLLLEDKWTPRKWRGPKQYENSKSGKDLMMLESDLALVADPELKKWVVEYANNEDKFFNDFSKAFSKLLELGVPFPEQTAVKKGFLARIFA